MQLSEWISFANKLADRFTKCEDPDARGVAVETVCQVLDRYPDRSSPDLRRIVTSAVREDLRRWRRRMHRAEQFESKFDAEERLTFRRLVDEVLDSVRPEDLPVAVLILDCESNDAIARKFGDGRSVRERVKLVRARLGRIVRDE